MFDLAAAISAVSATLRGETATPTPEPPGAGTLALAVLLEGTARALGAWDARVAGREHRVWKAIPSTKDLTP